MITVKRKLNLLSEERAKKKVPPGRIPRISRLMALAIRFDRLIREGKVTDHAELAQRTHVTQPRISQIMNLLHLAPGIQKELLFLPRKVEGKDPVHEKMRRPVCAEVPWSRQWEMMRRLRTL